MVVKQSLSDVVDCKVRICGRLIKDKMSNVLVVDKYSLNYALPSGIRLYVIEKKPKYSIKSLSQEFTVQVDADGLVLEVKDRSSLPGYFVEGNLPEVGSFLRKEELLALELIYGTSLISNLEKAYIENGYLRINLAGNKVVLFPLDEDRDFLLGALTLILNELKKEEIDSKITIGELKVIDLRFKNPVLRKNV